MILDNYRERWGQPSRTPQPFVPDPAPFYPPFAPVLPPTQEPPITDQELRELRELLKKARKYDQDNDQPDCESEQKMKNLLDLAEKLGVRENDRINCEACGGEVGFDELGNPFNFRPIVGGKYADGTQTLDKWQQRVVDHHPEVFTQPLPYGGLPFHLMVACST